MKYHTLFILALALLLPLSLGCDSNSNNGTGEPMQMTQFTGGAFTMGAFCQDGIDGFVNGDDVAVDFVLTDFVSGNATITNMTTGDEAKCDMGESMSPFTPSVFSCDSVSSSNISGLQVSDQFKIVISFTESASMAQITNQTTGRCLIVTLSTLNTS